MSREIFMLLGAPCSGKGTQCSLLEGTKIVECFSVGNVLRKQYAVGTKERDEIDNGKIVDESIVNETIENFLIAKMPTKSKILIDGYPRTVNQATSIKNFIDSYNLANSDQIFLTTIVLDTTNKDVLTSRMVNRRYCEICQKTYDNTIEKCCSYALSIRKDDTLDILNKRLQMYYDSIGEIRDILQNIVIINAVKSKEEIHKDVSTIIRGGIPS